MVTPPGPDARTRPRRAWPLVALVVLLVLFTFGAARFELPYYALRPGQVRNTELLISVDGVETYSADGSISYTTVSLRRLTLFGYLDAQLDRDVEVLPEEEVLGERDPDENRQFNLQLMDNSKQVAAQVALEKLGYTVDTSAAGERVLEVQEDMPADGLMEPGDVIVEVEGEPIDDPGDLARILSDNRPGDEIELTVQPFAEEEEKELSLELAAAPDDPQRGVMGVLVQPDGVEYHFPFEIEFDTGDVGGPSAGLAFTLGLLDRLTPGELTGGKAVAVTGTISSDGHVGEIGGVAQKAAAVRRSGAELFIVPAGNYEDAVARAGDVEVVPVETLDDALAALADLGGNALDLPTRPEGAGV
ncbi:MAG TPA: PDZ domain-containing protein [Acidimicrobiales bacterium]